MDFAPEHGQTDMILSERNSWGQLELCWLIQMANANHELRTRLFWQGLGSLAVRGHRMEWSMDEHRETYCQKELCGSKRCKLDRRMNIKCEGIMKKQDKKLQHAVFPCGPPPQY